MQNKSIRSIMDYLAARINLEIQFLKQQREAIEVARENLIFQEKAEKREQNKKLLQKLMTDNGHSTDDLARGLNVLNAIFQDTELSLGELFDALSENLADSHPQASLSAEQLWVFLEGEE